MKKATASFIERVNPNRPRSRLIAWPLGGDDKVVVRMLSDDDLERAYFAAKDHFDSLKVNGKKRHVDVKDVAFQNRERLEMVWLAFRVPDGDKSAADLEPIAESSDELAQQPNEVIDALYFAWADFQKEARAKPPEPTAVRALVDALKKNTPAAALLELPSSWLIAVITTLVEPSSSSTTPSDSGS